MAAGQSAGIAGSTVLDVSRSQKSCLQGVMKARSEAV